MDGNRFDHLTRILANERSRRSTLKILAGGVAAGVAGLFRSGDALAAVRCRSTLQICRKNSDCCSKKCGPANYSGRRYCECATSGDCPAPSNQCLSAVCAAGACSTVPACTDGQICYRNGCCTPAIKETTCAGKCGNILNNCGQTVDCGPCCTPNGGDCESNSTCCGVCIDGSCADASGPGGACDDTSDCQSGLFCCAGNCAACCESNDCPAFPNECGSYSCTQGECTPVYVSINTPTTAQTAGDCKENQCNGAGEIVSVNDDSDVPLPDNQCLTGQCSGGIATTPPALIGSECDQDGGSYCDGAGNCVECTGTSQCLQSSSIISCSSVVCKPDYTCGVEYAPLGTPVSDETIGDCAKKVCDGTGSIITVESETDIPVNITECQIGTCDGTTVVVTDKDAGVECTEGVCDGAGACVGCLNETTCAGTELCCGGFCTDTDSNNDHCGTCDAPCTLDEICCAGLCVDPNTSLDHCGTCSSPCDPDQLCCEGICRSVMSDVDFCGACDFSCDSGESCCDGVCTDTNSDSLNCGSCGSSCSNDQTCCDSICVDTSTDNSYCGNCTTTCSTPDEVCCDSTCTGVLSNDTSNCGGCGVTCTDGQACCSGVCSDLGSDSTCGGCEYDCTSTGQYCAAGATVCVDCIDDDHCDGDEICCGGLCHDPGSNDTCGNCETICTDSNQVCDGAGSCVDCVVHADCANFCVNNVCVDCLPNPETCSSHGDCCTGYCAGNVCTTP